MNQNPLIIRIKSVFWSSVQPNNYCTTPLNSCSYTLHHALWIQNDRNHGCIVIDVYSIDYSAFSLCNGGKVCLFSLCHVLSVHDDDDVCNSSPFGEWHQSDFYICFKSFWFCVDFNEGPFWMLCLSPAVLNAHRFHLMANSHWRLGKVTGHRMPTL